MRVLEAPDILHTLARTLIGILALARNAVSAPFDEPLTVPFLKGLDARAPVASGRWQYSLECLSCRTIPRLARGMEGNCRIAASIAITLTKEAGYVTVRIGVAGIIPDGLGALGVEQDHILHIAVGLASEVLWIALDSCDVVAKVFRPKYLIHQHLHVVPDLVVDVQVDGSAIRKQGAQQLEALTQKGDKRFARDPVGVCDFSTADTADGIGPALADAKGGVGRERRVDIDEVDATAESVLENQLLHGSNIVTVNKQTRDIARVPRGSCARVLDRLLD